MKKVLIFTDNQLLLNSFRIIISNDLFSKWEFDYACSTIKFENDNADIELILIKEKGIEYFQSYGLIISLHCKQLFPDWLFRNIRCVNVHPGFNPYNRGWYPQVFSILNGLPIGATIHEIDSELDHGNIIAQEEIKAFSWDNSYTLYQRIIQTEIFLLKGSLEKVLKNSYSAAAPTRVGNLNLKRDFKELLEFDLNKTMTGREFLNYMRAMTHLDFKNLYYIDPETNIKVYIQIKLEPKG